MKVFIVAIAVLASTNVFAAPNCNYVLDQEAYWEDASGKLTVDAIDYKCESLYLGQEGDMITACKDPFSKNQHSYDLVVFFDGAEGDFFVSIGLQSARKSDFLCKGTASEK